MICSSSFLLAPIDVHYGSPSFAVCDCIPCVQNPSSGLGFMPFVRFNAYMAAIVGKDQAIYAAMPMTPQAGRGPALPVFLLSSFPPLPRSSVPAWTTMVRCTTQAFVVSHAQLYLGLRGGKGDRHILRECSARRSA